MGFLSSGKPLLWRDSQALLAYVKEHGIEQLIAIWNNMKTRHGDGFLWGDEIEAFIVAFVSEQEANTPASGASSAASAAGAASAGAKSSATSSSTLHSSSPSDSALPSLDALTLTASNSSEFSGVTDSPRLTNSKAAVVLSLRGPEILEKLEHLISAAKADYEKMQLQQQAHVNGSASATSVTMHTASSSSVPFQFHSSFVPEYGSFMIEATPAKPYGGLTSDLRVVEANMHLRRSIISSVLNSNEVMMTLTAFPLLGVLPNFTSPAEPLPNPQASHVSKSLYITDDIISPHPRFATLTANIRERRGEKVVVRVPIYKDCHTFDHLKEKGKSEDVNGHANENGNGNGNGNSSSSSSGSSSEKETKVPPGVDLNHEVYLDAMGFGMGMCCLQVTFQTRDVDEARLLYDHLSVLSPILLAMTAATPILQGKLVETDARWGTIAGAVDDRTARERGAWGDREDDESEDAPHVILTPTFRPCGCSSKPISSSPYAEISTKTTWLNPPESSKPLSGPREHKIVGSTPDGNYAMYRSHRLYKSRYDSISTYIAHDKALKPQYNDIDVEINEAAYRRLQAAGMDELLARHFAHLWVRDPLVIYEQAIQIDDQTRSDHFENLQSTNWQNVRFKPPPPNNKSIGWRVEFRTMEAQVTDFESAAFTVFVALLSRAILYFKLNLYIPLSKVDENFQRAHQRNAILTQKFYFKKHIYRKQCSQAQNSAAESKEQSANRNDHEATQPAASSAASSSSSSWPSNGSNGGAREITNTCAVSDEYEELTIHDIMNGNGPHPGLIPLVKTYLDLIESDEETKKVVHRYLDLIERRCNGQLMTAATWMRKFVSRHPSYKGDSVINQAVASDVVSALSSLAKGEMDAPQLLGNLHTISQLHIPSTDPLAAHIHYNAWTARENSYGENNSSMGVPLASTPAPHLVDLDDSLVCFKLREHLIKHRKPHRKIHLDSKAYKRCNAPEYVQTPLTSSVSSSSSSSSASAALTAPVLPVFPSSVSLPDNLHRGESGPMLSPTPNAPSSNHNHTNSNSHRS